MKYDYLIVGAGFAGAVLAERIASQLNKKVLIIDKRDHIGGNCYDYYNEIGVLVHKYGPHCFHTNSKKVFDYLSKFTKWRNFELRVRALVKGDLYPIPINRNTLNNFFDVNLEDEKDVKEFLDKKRKKIEKPKNSEEQVISLAGKEIYENFFKNYTIKQWGLNPKELDASVCARIPIRTNTDDRYFTDEYQVMPLEGYTKMFEKMLNHKNITVKLNTSFKKIKDKIKYDKLIYTGCIDDFFDYKFGKLGYRSLKFKHENYDKEYHQEFCNINYPNDNEFTRIVEIKHATGQKHSKTTIVKEYPKAKGDPYYPIPKKENHRLYEKYKKEAEKLKKVIFVGRLAQYKYYNMDQVVEEGLNVFERIENE